MTRAIHHLELWVTDLARAGSEWEWLLGELGWESDHAWGSGRSWSHPDGTSLLMDSSEDVVDEPHDRMRPGMNHVALVIEERELLDRIRGASTEHGWHELYSDRFPYAGSDRHASLYLESSEGFEVEIVCQETEGTRERAERPVS